jgi:hypothetical protein
VLFDMAGSAHRRVTASSLLELEKAKIDDTNDRQTN